MYISPKHNSKDDDWHDPTVNLDQFSHIQTVILDDGSIAIQFINQGGHIWVSWLYADTGSRDKEFKRIQRLTKWPGWISSLAIMFGY